MNEKVLVGPKFGTLIHSNWITIFLVVTTFFLLARESAVSPSAR
jgi:hypothetical protein